VVETETGPLLSHLDLLSPEHGIYRARPRGLNKLCKPCHRSVAMLQTFRSCTLSTSRKVFPRPPLRSTSVAVPSLRPKNWRLNGVPAPPPIATEPSIDLTEEIEDERVGPIHGLKPHKRPTPIYYQNYKSTIQEHFPEGWSPPRKLSREAMDGLRELHRFDPDTFTTPVLADRFRISPEAVRRILKSKWEPTREQRSHLAEREKRNREERIKMNRLEEIKKQVMVRMSMENELVRLNRLSAKRDHASSVYGRPPRDGERGDHGVQRRPRGRNSTDKLFFT
jgi:hypothetical protein